MTTGEKIKMRREFLQLTQYQLGELIGVHESTISEYELGLATPGVEQVVRLCEALKVNRGYFGKGLPYPRECTLLGHYIDIGEGDELPKGCYRSGCMKCGWYEPELKRRNEMMARGEFADRDGIQVLMV